MKGGPIRFLLGVVGLWCLARSLMLWPPSLASLPRLTFAPPLAAERPAPDIVRGSRIRLALAPPPARMVLLDRPAVTIVMTAYVPPEQTYVLHRPGAAAPPSNDHAPIPLFEQPRSVDRWSASSWAIARPGGGEDALATAGLLGGSQAGARVAYALGNDLALAGRLSSPLSNGRGGREAAFGIEWWPIADMPFRLSAERRVALDRGGRDAFAVGLAGGVDNIALPSGLRLDAYAQAGVVGIRSRDGYADGALRIERPVWEGDGISLSLGAGAWGAVQPRVGRLDLGPQAVLRVPAGPTTLRIGVDWRERIAGNARPGSGPAISIGADF